MTRSNALVVLGLLIALVPYSGLPVSMRAGLETVLGLLVFAVGIGFRLTHQRATAAAKAGMTIKVKPAEQTAGEPEAAQEPAAPSGEAVPPAGVSPI